MSRAVTQQSDKHGHAVRAIEQAIRDGHAQHVLTQADADRLVDDARSLTDPDRARLHQVNADLYGDTSVGSTSNGLGPALAPVSADRWLVPPQNSDAEASVLGAAMMSSGAIEACREILSPAGDDFYSLSHGTIWRAVLALHDTGEPVDAITLTNRLEQEGELDGVGGRVRMHELAALVPASANAGHYAAIVHGLALRRALIRAGSETAKLGWEGEGAPEDLVEQAQEQLYRLTPDDRKGAAEPILGPTRQTFQRMVDLAESGQEIVGLATGFHDLDRVTAGLEPGNLIVVAARPGMGKSALALAVAANVAIRQKLPVCHFSLEMSKGELAQRLLAREAHVNLAKIRAPGRRTDQEEWSRLAHAAGQLEQAPLYVDDRGGLTLSSLRSELRRVQAKQPALALVIVDYLQLMRVPTMRPDNRTAIVTEISGGLKAVAREFQVPVMALSQLNRAVEARTEKRPTLADLRDSGSVEQDADLVCFLYRDGYYNEQTAHPDVAELDIAKHRNGAGGDVKLAWRKDWATFTEVAR